MNRNKPCCVFAVMIVSLYVDTVLKRIPYSLAHLKERRKGLLIGTKHAICLGAVVKSNAIGASRSGREPGFQGNGQAFPRFKFRDFRHNHEPAESDGSPGGASLQLEKDNRTVCLAAREKDHAGHVGGDGDHNSIPWMVERC